MRSPEYCRTTKQRLRLVVDLGEIEFSNPGKIRVVELVGRFHQVIQNPDGSITYQPLDATHEVELRRRIASGKRWC